jgi:uncharacterized membrane protein YbhN (UPF0104 family)
VAAILGAVDALPSMEFCLVPMSRHPFVAAHNDEVLARRLIALRPRLRLLETDDPSAVLGVFEALSAAVCMRYHSLLFAERAGIPIVPIAYAEKCLLWLAERGLEPIEPSAAALTAEIEHGAGAIGMRRRLPTVIRWFVAIGLVAIVLTRFDVGAVATRISAANLLLAVPAIGGLVAIHLVGAVAWRRLLEEFGGIRTDWRSAVRLYYAAQAVGSITPGNLGADVYRIAAVDAPSTRRAAAVPILLQRVTSTAAMVLLGAAGLVTLGSRELVQRSFVDALPLVVAAVSIATVVVATGALWFRAELLAAWAQGREHLAGLLRNGLGLGLLFHAASIGLGWVLVAAIDPGTASRSGEVLAILAVARLSVVLPLSPAGLGVQEAAVGVLFAQVGLDPQVALAAILLNRVALLVVVVLGAAGLLRGRAARARAATPAPTATTAGTPQPAPTFRQARTPTMRS